LIRTSVVGFILGLRNTMPFKLFLKMCVLVNVFIGIFATFSFELLPKEFFCAPYMHLFLNFLVFLLMGWAIVYIPAEK